MGRRVLYEAGGGRPLRISASSSVDPTLAEFNDLIFDANQPPLRLWGTGYTQIPGITRNEWNFGKNVNEGSPISVFGAPVGQTPIFMTMWRSGDTSGYVNTPSFKQSTNAVEGGAGGAICNGNIFVPVCFRVGAPANPDSYPPLTWVDYAVFRNVQ
ncbi:hypothetical protein [Bradyrhizobium cenepequi]